jgi:hypothetical protein
VSLLRVVAALSLRRGEKRERSVGDVQACLRSIVGHSASAESFSSGCLSLLGFSSDLGRNLDTCVEGRNSNRNGNLYDLLVSGADFGILDPP